MNQSPAGRPKNFPLTLIGHLFAPLGRGEDLRCAARAAREVNLPFALIDLDPAGRYPDPDLEAEFNRYLGQDTSSGVNLFFINGDEVAHVLKRMPAFEDGGSKNVVVPNWELENYPRAWAGQLDRFDEVWAPSRFSYASFAQAVSIPIKHVPLPVEVRLNSFLPRRYFGLPESSFLFLFFFDYSSYMERKNPSAVIEAFEKVCVDLGWDDFRLVIKTSAPWSSTRFQEMEQEIVRRIERSPFRDRVILIRQTMTDNEVKNLIRCCNSFISLHRSEGFGRGLAEAMFLGKPVIGTGYSGNLDFMHPDTAYLVDYSLIPVQEGQYPHGEGQVWAEPDTEQAAEYMKKVFQEREEARQMGKNGSLEIRKHFSYRAVGLRYRDLLSSDKYLS